MVGGGGGGGGGGGVKAKDQSELTFWYVSKPNNSNPGTYVSPKEVALYNTVRTRDST